MHAPSGHLGMDGSRPIDSFLGPMLAFKNSHTDPYREGRHGHPQYPEYDTSTALADFRRVEN